jgi:hypothetical protein
MKLTNLLSTLIVLSMGTLTTQVAAAQTLPTPATPAKCSILRTATATVTVTRQYWEQDGGIWIQKHANIAQVNPEVNVYKESNAGCTIQKALELDNLIINGVSESVRIYAYIAVQGADLHPTPNKVFTASYWLSSDNGHTAFASAFTPDLTVKKIGVSFNKERASTSATAHEDTINVVVVFNDSAAQ